MAGEIGVAEVNGLAKRVYDKSGIAAWLPEQSIFQRAMSWEKGTRKVGESYQIPVVVRMPNGFTYVGSTGVATALNNPVNMVIKQASVTPFELDLREQAVWTALSRAAAEDEGSFAQLNTTMQKAMKQAASTRLEIALIHGQRGLGVVDSVTDLTGGLANIVITVGSWAPGMWWAVGEGAFLDSFTSTTKNNTGTLQISGITASTRTIKVTYTGTIASDCAAGDVLYFKGAWDGTTYTEMPGVLAQSANTSGTSLGLSAGTYSQWAGNTYDVSGNISSDIVEDAAGQLRDRGVSGKLSFACSNKCFGSLMSELKQLRVIDSSYQPAVGKQGFKSVAYYSPDIGEIEVINHSFFKNGEAWLGSFDVTARVGSSDIMFGVPGINNDCPVWEKVAGYNTAEITLFTDQVGVVKVPSHTMTLTGITYT
jgi:hypothetical protein